MPFRCLPLKMRRYQRLDAHLERLGERVTEYLRGSPVPQDYLLARSIRDYHRVPDPLEEPADSQIFQPHELRSTPHHESRHPRDPLPHSFSRPQRNQYPQNPTRASQMRYFRTATHDKTQRRRPKNAQNSPTKPPNP
jgi:hypothetical protein